MSDPARRCPDCQEEATDLSRRNFLRTAGAVVAVGALPATALADKQKKNKDKAAKKEAKVTSEKAPETVVKLLYDSLKEEQRGQVCFDWDHQDPKRGLLRTFISNNWNITSPQVKSDYYTAEQQAMIREIFEGIIQPEWHEKIDKQLQDDAGGFGRRQSIAIFGKPGGGEFEFVLTGRHMTLRCDGNSADHVAFGGPIFYGHAAGGFNEKPDHPGNVFWPQALAANDVYKMLDGKQRKLALVEKSPRESAVQFGGSDGKRPGIPVSELADDQKSQVQVVLQKLIEPYRQDDQDEVLQCLKKQGGLDGCSLAFYRQRDLGGDEVWDNWRLEGPSFVWYFRGAPHVHVWANVADSPDVTLNA